MDNFNFWLDVDTSRVDSTVKWGFDIAGINGTAQTIADVFTAPTNVQWFTASNEPTVSNVGKLLKGEYFPVWVWWHLEPNAISRTDDKAIFNFSFLIPGGGTPNPGSGGAATFDVFGVRKIFPTKSGGTEWFSSLWSNGHSRDVGPNGFDSDDPNFGYLDEQPVPNPITINGDGTCSLNNHASGGHRMFVKGTWTNTEQTIYFKLRTGGVNPTNLDLRSRSNHHGANYEPYGYDAVNDISCGFGNYMIKWDRVANRARNLIEVVHAFYGTVSGFDCTFPTVNTWCGFKQITRTVGTTVVDQGYINYDINNQNAWTKVAEFIYTGSNVTIDTSALGAEIAACTSAGDSIAGDVNNHTFWPNPGHWCWCRIDGGQNMDLKFYSVREIDPEEEGSNPNPDPDPGGGGTNPPPATTDWKIAVIGDEGCGSTTNTITRSLQNL